MEFFETVVQRRSARSFESETDISDQDINKILKTAQLAPSAGNTQCARFFVVRDKVLKRRIAREAGHQPFIDEAPVAIVVVADLEAVGATYGERGRNTYALQDTAAAIQNILLAATDLGYGSCWVGAFEENRASEILGLSPNMRPLAIIPIGFPSKEVTRIPPRKSLEEVTVFV